MDKDWRGVVAGAVNMSRSLRTGTESIVGAIMWPDAPWNTLLGDHSDGRLRSRLIRVSLE